MADDLNNGMGRTDLTVESPIGVVRESVWEWEACFPGGREETVFAVESDLVLVDSWNGRHSLVVTRQQASLLILVEEQLACPA